MLVVILRSSRKTDSKDSQKCSTIQKLIRIIFEDAGNTSEDCRIHPKTSEGSLPKIAEDNSRYLCHNSFSLMLKKASEYFFKGLMSNITCSQYFG